MKKINKWCSSIIFTIFILTIPLSGSFPVEPIEIKRPQEAIVSGKPSIDTSLDIILAKLINCESGGRIDAIGDHGKAFSILQFHKPTFEGFGKKYGLPHDDILNPVQQIEIAKAMITNEKNGLDHWRNCRLKLGL